MGGTMPQWVKRTPRGSAERVAWTRKQSARKRMERMKARAKRMGLDQPTAQMWFGHKPDDAGQPCQCFDCLYGETPWRGPVDAGRVCRRPVV